LLLPSAVAALANIDAATNVVIVIVAAVLLSPSPSSSSAI
jgi:hypothetical protein